VKYLNLSLSLIAIGTLAFFYFAHPKTEKTTTSLSIAYVNSDTLWNKYGFTKDIEKQLQGIEEGYQNQYLKKANAFQMAYNDFAKKAQAGLLSANDQQRISQQLGGQENELMMLDQQLSLQLADTTRKLNAMVQDTILSFLEKYNETANYTYILQYTKGGAVLITDEALDITEAILEGLNKEYEEVKND